MARRGALLALLVVVAPACGQRLAAAPAAPPPVVAASEPTPAPEAAEPVEAEERAPDRVPAVPAVGRATPPPPPRPGAPLEARQEELLPPVPLSTDRVAVVIGIDRYGNADRNLTAAVADARLVARALRRAGFGQIRLLLNGRATRDAILDSAAWLARRSRPGTVGAFFYAGHVRQFDGDLDRDGEHRDEAMVDPTGTPVFDGEIAAALSRSRGSLWLAWAACYAAGFSDAAAPGRVSTYASAENRLAYESSALGHSFMVEYMVGRAMLQGALTSVEEMHRYASNQMTGKERRFRPLQDDQVPGPLWLAAPPPAAPAAPAAPPPATPPADDGRQCLMVLRCRT